MHNIDANVILANIPKHPFSTGTECIANLLLGSEIIIFQLGIIFLNLEVIFRPATTFQIYDKNNSFNSNTLPNKARSNHPFVQRHCYKLMANGVRHVYRLRRQSAIRLMSWKSKVLTSQFDIFAHFISTLCLSPSYDRLYCSSFI